MVNWVQMDGYVTWGRRSSDLRCRQQPERKRNEETVSLSVSIASSSFLPQAHECPKSPSLLHYQLVDIFRVQEWLEITKNRANETEAPLYLLYELTQLTFFS